MLRVAAFSLLLVSCMVTARSLSRSKRQAYVLPDGVEIIVGSVKTTFTCSGNGYYADVDNNCQIFHVCDTVTHPDGNTETLQYSFMCGNQTVFNQATLTCALYEDAVPCSSARDFYYVNNNIGVEKVPFLTDEDVDRAVRLYPARLGETAVRTAGGGGARPRGGK